MDAAELEEAYEVIPRDREIILFCACPNEVTAARLALLPCAAKESPRYGRSPKAMKAGVAVVFR